MIPRHRIKSDIDGRGLHRLFQEDHVDLGINRYKFVAIVTTLMNGILDIAMRGHDVALPYRLGSIVTRAIKVTAPVIINYEETKKLRREYPDKSYKAYHTNDHTDGKIIKFMWLKEAKPITNKQFYTLKFNRTKKSELAARLKNPDIANNYYDFISWRDEYRNLKKKRTNEQSKNME